jgi:hypothetical protein
LDEAICNITVGDVDIDITHSHRVMNNNGVVQFTYGINEGIRFEGLGDTSITFDSSTKKVKISSTDQKVKVSATEDSAQYLIDQLSAGAGIGLSKITSGSDETIRIFHSDTSSVSNIDTAGAEIIDTVTFDTFGHVQTITTRQLTLSDLSYILPTVNNGLTADIPTNYQLGGTLLKNTLIDTQGFRLTIQGSNSKPFSVVGTNNQAASFEGVNVGIASYGASIPVWAINSDTTTNSVKKGVVMNATTTVGAVGLGISLVSDMTNGVGSTMTAGEIRTVWTSVSPSASSKLDFYLLNNNSFGRKFSIASNGDVTMDAYPNSRTDGTTNKALYVAPDGRILYGTIDGIGGGGLGSAYVTITDGTNNAGASGTDIIKFRSGNNLLDVTIGSNDLSHGDNVLYTVNTTNLAEFVQDTIGASLIAGGGVTITYNDVGNVITISSSTYSDEQAEDAVGNILIDTDSIDLTYDDTGNEIRADVKNEYFKVYELKFIVGYEGAPAEAGDTTFILADCASNLMTNKKIIIYRERYRQFQDYDYTYDSSTAEIVLASPLIEGETLVFECHPTHLWDECTLGTVPTGFPYIFPSSFP